MSLANLEVLSLVFCLYVADLSYVIEDAIPN